MVTRTVLAVILVVFAWPNQADAQIYAWRDASGNLVLSDRRLDGAAKTYAVPEAPSFRSTRPVASDDVTAQFEPLGREHAARQSLRPDLVRAVIQVESGFNPWARSPKGAMGLIQLRPGSGAAPRVRNPYDPRAIIGRGTTSLRQLLERYEGTQELALGA